MVLLSLPAWPQHRTRAKASVAMEAERADERLRVASAQPATPVSGDVSVVEFYHAALDHYFITGNAKEALDLDTGVHPGWRRTGLSFAAYGADYQGSNPVCRFYIPPAFGDSHFYSASLDECARTHAEFPAFEYESASVFHVRLPDTTSGACPDGMRPVYRLWNGRIDGNHRYTSDRSTWQRMKDAGWVAEGYGSDQVVMCSPPARTIGSVDVAVAGMAVIKARAVGDVVAVLQERLTSIFEQGPERTLGFLQSDGRSLHTYQPPSGWSLVDFAVHPSGEVSVLLTTSRAVRILKLDREGLLRDDQMLVDPGVAMDPFLDFGGGIKDDDALQPALMRDAARLVPLGESIALVLRTGRNALVAYRFDADAHGAYQRAWRTLVEPGSSLFGRFLSSGSFDTFGQLQNVAELHVDVDAQGTLAIALVELPFHSFAFEAHAAYFGEPIAAQAGVLVARISGSDGARLGVTVIDTNAEAELHGMRATATGWMLVGRLRSEVRPDGGGWNAFAVAIARDGAQGALRVLDYDQGDVLFDAAMLPSGRLLAAGTTGYVQNPSGASISEDARPLLVLLDVDGAPLQRFELPDGPRQDQVRTVTSLAGRWLIGGMRNGPGTHSGDSQPSLITADGFLLEMEGVAER